MKREKTRPHLIGVGFPADPPGPPEVLRVVRYNGPARFRPGGRSSRGGGVNHYTVWIRWLSQDFVVGVDAPFGIGPINVLTLNGEAYCRDTMLSARGPSPPRRCTLEALWAMSGISLTTAWRALHDAYGRGVRGSPRGYVPAPGSGERGRYGGAYGPIGHTGEWRSVEGMASTYEPQTSQEVIRRGSMVGAGLAGAGVFITIVAPTALFLWLIMRNKK